MRQLTGCQVGQETGGRGKGVAGVKTDGGVKKKCEVKMKDIGVGYKGGGAARKSKAMKRIKEVEKERQEDHQILSVMRTRLRAPVNQRDATAESCLVSKCSGSVSCFPARKFTRDRETSPLLVTDRTD